MSSKVITRSIHNPIRARVAELKMKKKIYYNITILQYIPQISSDIIVKKKVPSDSLKDNFSTTEGKEVIYQT